MNTDTVAPAVIARKLTPVQRTALVAAVATGGIFQPTGARMGQTMLTLRAKGLFARDQRTVTPLGFEVAALLA